MLSTVLVYVDAREMIAKFKCPSRLRSAPQGLLFKSVHKHFGQYNAKSYFGRTLSLGGSSIGT